MTTATPSSPDRLLDSKTFVFNQFIPLSFPPTSVLGETINMFFNASPNGYEY